MKKPADKFDQILAEKLTAFEAAPDGNAWKEFQQRKGKKRNSRWFWLPVILLPLLLAGLFFMLDGNNEGIENVDPSKSITEKTSQSKVQSAATKSFGSEEKGNEVIAPNEEPEKNFTKQKQANIAFQQPKQQIFSITTIGNKINFISTEAIKTEFKEIQQLPQIDSPPTPQPKPSRQLRIGAEIRPSLTYTNTKNTGAAEKVHEDYRSIINSAQTPQIGFSLGFMVDYPLLPQLGLRSGINYSEWHSQTQLNFRHNKIPVVDSASGNILGYIRLPDSSAMQIDTTAKNFTRFLEIPVTVVQNFRLSEKWDLVLSLGGSISYNLQQKHLSINEVTLQPQQMETGSRFNTTVRIGAGFGRQLKNNHYLQVLPYYSRATLPAHSQPNIRSTNHSIGISATLLFPANLNKN